MTCRHEIILGGPCRQCGRPNHMPLTCEQAEEKQRAAIRRILSSVNWQKPLQETEMTTKVRITNIVEEGNARSNGDIVVHGLEGGRKILAPGESCEAWLKHNDIPEPLTITERWPSQAAK